jgi:SAM-dependent methyltransferase
MNWVHRRLCASAWWRRHVRDDLTPWVLAGLPAARDTVDIGHGPGATNDFLLGRTDSLTGDDLDDESAARLAGRHRPRLRVLCEDAAAMSLESGSFDLAVTVAMLHHVRERAQQDRILGEIARVLRPGGVLAGYEITSGLLVRVMHWGDTMTLIEPYTLPQRLRRAGFDDVSIAKRASGYRFRATKRA